MTIVTWVLLAFLCAIAVSEFRNLVKALMAIYRVGPVRNTLTPEGE